MELKQLWSVIVRRWWLVVIPAVVALALSIGSLKTLVSPPLSYEVTIRFTASQRPNNASSPTENFDRNYTVWLASEYVVNNLASWMNTESFASAIESRLDRDHSIDPGTLRSVIHSDSARSIMTLNIAGLSDPDLLKTVAQAAVDVLQHDPQTYWPEIGTQPIEIVQLDAITPTPVSFPLASRFSGLLRFGIGLAAGVGLAFLAEYLDPTIHDRADVEALGLSVIAEIPRG